MKIVISFLSLFIAGILNLNAQTKYISKTGHVSFFSSTPLENIEAHNRQVLSIVDLSSGKVAVTMLMKAFEFEKALMQEHFNENYVESGKFPKATFKGKISDYEQVDFSKPKEYSLDVEGILTIHGISKNINTTIKLVVSDELHATGKINIKLKDYGIKIPKLVAQNISEGIKISLDINHKKYK